MVITLTGSNTHALKRRLDELAAKFIAEHGDLALERLDAEETNAQSVVDSVQSLPFLASKKMVILRAPSTNKDVSESIEKIITATGDTTDLVIYDPHPDKRTAYFKTLQKQTQLEQFTELDNVGLAKWLVSEAKARGGEITYADASFLVERVGTDQTLLANELDKLLLYNKKISRASIELLTDLTPQTKIFELLDAAFGHDKKRALKLYEEQRAQKVEPQAILAMIAWQLQLLVLVSLGSGRQLSSIAQDAGMRPFPVNKAAGLVKRLDDNKLKEMVAELFSIDWRSKTSAIDLDEALKTYIVTL